MQKVRKGVKKMKDKDYYTKSYDKYSQNTKYQCDLEEGKIRIYEVPFEYRDGLAYVLARKAIRLGDLKRECRKKEKRLLAEQLMGDIIVCKNIKRKVRIYPLNILNIGQKTEYEICEVYF